MRIKDYIAKEQKINVPEGYEIDKENSTFECIKFKPIEEVKTYYDVAEKLFKGKTAYFITKDGDICEKSALCVTTNENIYEEFGYARTIACCNRCTSDKQGKKLLAINLLMNVAKYLNDGWSPDWNNDKERKYSFYIKGNGVIGIVSTTEGNSHSVYFKSAELAKKAIDILEDSTIYIALSTDW